MLSLPDQPEGVPWPTGDWPVGGVAPDVDVVASLAEILASFPALT